MPIAFKQTITLKAASQSADADGILVDPVIESPGTSKACSFETAPRGIDFPAYGIDPSKGARALVPWVDRNAYPLMAEVDYDGEAYVVRSLGAQMEHLRLGYAELILERVA